MSESPFLDCFANCFALLVETIELACLTEGLRGETEHEAEPYTRLPIRFRMEAFGRFAKGGANQLCPQLPGGRSLGVGRDVEQVLRLQRLPLVHPKFRVERRLLPSVNPDSVSDLNRAANRYRWRLRVSWNGQGQVSGEHVLIQVRRLELQRQFATDQISQDLDEAGFAAAVAALALVGDLSPLRNEDIESWTERQSLEPRVGAREFTEEHAPAADSHRARSR